jgi:hypothetical protein
MLSGDKYCLTLSRSPCSDGSSGDIFIVNRFIYQRSKEQAFCPPKISVFGSNSQSPSLYSTGLQKELSGFRVAQNSSFCSLKTREGQSGNSKCHVKSPLLQTERIGFWFFTLRQLFLSCVSLKGQDFCQAQLVLERSTEAGNGTQATVTMNIRWPRDMFICTKTCMV